VIERRLIMMKKIFKKKVNFFGKEISVFLLAIIGVVGLASAALIPYFGTIIGEVGVTQGLVLDDGEWDVPIIDELEDITSLESSIQETSHILENEAEEATAFFALALACEAAESDCDGVSTTIKYPLFVEGVQGTEDRIVVSAEEAGVSTLGDLESMSWDVFGGLGYAPHVDVRIDIDGDGEADDTLVFEYAKVDPLDCDDAGDYPTGDFNTFSDKGMVDDTAWAWLGSGPPGPCGDGTFDSMHNSLSEWKIGTLGVDETTKVIRFELEVDNWIVDSSADLTMLEVNGVEVSGSYLAAGETLDFDLVYGFDKLLRPDIYTMTTTVEPA
jgi:hypothetical protein